MWTTAVDQDNHKPLWNPRWALLNVHFDAHRVRLRGTVARGTKHLACALCVKLSAEWSVYLPWGSGHPQVRLPSTSSVNDATVSKSQIVCQISQRHPRCIHMLSSHFCISWSLGCCPFNLNFCSTVWHMSTRYVLHSSFSCPCFDFICLWLP